MALGGGASALRSASFARRRRAVQSGSRLRGDTPTLSPHPSRRRERQVAPAVRCSSTYALVLSTLTRSYTSSSSVAVTRSTSQAPQVKNEVMGSSAERSLLGATTQHVASVPSLSRGTPPFFFLRPRRVSKPHARELWITSSRGRARAGADAASVSRVCVVYRVKGASRRRGREGDAAPTPHARACANRNNARGS